MKKFYVGQIVRVKSTLSVNVGDVGHFLGAKTKIIKINKNRIWVMLGDQIEPFSFNELDKRYMHD